MDKEKEIEAKFYVHDLSFFENRLQSLGDRSDSNFAAVGSELDRVHEKVLEHVADLVSIDLGVSEIRVEIEFDGLPTRREIWGHHRDRLLNHAEKRHAPKVERVGEFIRAK